MASRRDNFDVNHAFGSVRRHFAITVNTPFVETSDAIYIGADGDATITDEMGNTVEYKNLKAGTILPLRATNITTASGSDYVGLVCL